MVLVTLDFLATKPWLTTPSINPIERARLTSLDVTFLGTFMFATESGSATDRPGSPWKQPAAMEGLVSAPKHIRLHGNSVRSAAVSRKQQKKPESVKNGC